MNKKIRASKTILVVEDEAVVRDLVQRVLGAGAFELVLAGSIQEGIHRIDEGRCDLLLTDLRLPDGNGVEVIHYFKVKFPSRPVVVMTGSLTPEERMAEAAAVGVIHCIHKPFVLSDFQSLINEAVNGVPHGRY